MTQDMACTDEKICKRCNSSNCNRDIFPADRLSCYKCVGGQCLNNPMHEPCIDYETGDECFSQFNGCRFFV